MPKNAAKKLEVFVKWFRSATPFIHEFGGGTIVIAFGGEVLSDGELMQLAHDINVLVSLEVRVVLVHGTRPQIEDQLKQHGVTPRYAEGRRITDDAALKCVKEANGIVRMEIEATLSTELANSPMAGADRVVISLPPDHSACITAWILCTPARYEKSMSKASHVAWMIMKWC